MKKSISASILFFLIFAVLTMNIAQILYSTEPNLLNKAAELINAKKYDEAISLLQEAQNKEPYSVEINLTLGLVYFELEKYSLAEDSFLRVIHSDPNCIPAHYSLAMIYEKNKKFADAVNEWKKIINITKEKTLTDFAKKHINFIESQLK